MSSVYSGILDSPVFAASWMPTTTTTFTPTPTPEAVSEVLTVERMREWASRFPKDAVIGTSNHRFDCPIARFLSQTFGCKFSVSSWGVTPYFGTRVIETPLWAKRFVYVIDICFSGEVTAAQVLSTLADAEHAARAQQDYEAVLYHSTSASALKAPVMQPLHPSLLDEIAAIVAEANLQNLDDEKPEKKEAEEKVLVSA